jgi:lipopolysaccharide biosynthesis regulator YciM
MAFYRDWWAGARYALYAQKAGQASRLISGFEHTLAARPADVEAKLALGYLYRGRGDTPAADRMFTALEKSVRSAGK